MAGNSAVPWQVIEVLATAASRDGDAADSGLNFIDVLVIGVTVVADLSVGRVPSSRGLHLNVTTLGIFACQHWRVLDGGVRVF